MKIYFLFGFLVTLCSLCFCRNIAKDKFIIDKFFTIRKFDFFIKKKKKQYWFHIDQAFGLVDWE